MTNATRDQFAESALFADLDEDRISRLTELSLLREFDSGSTILRTGNYADVLFIVRDGLVAVEVASPAGGSLVIDTLGPGAVLGISWMLPPYRWSFDGRAVERTSAIEIDAVGLRELCETDHELGYLLYRGLTGEIQHRLQGARIRLLDLYGAPA